MKSISKTTGNLLILTLLMAVCFNGGVQAQKQGDQETESKENRSRSEKEPSRKALEEPQEVDTNVSDKNLKKYSEARVKMRKIRQESLPKMEKAIKDAGLTQDRYKAIVQQKQGTQKNPNSQSDRSKADISDQEMKKFRNAQREIQKLQQKSQQRMVKALEDIGLERSKFREIGRALQQSKTLQKRMREMNKK